ncbi:uncharacterized protein LOC141700997 isoform X1 [Apium graveolens]|uniref:uncharacterized protein LOC141700997 isoform X1 n=1 Tax=Apium graveolens TaxID=4045 RepID=UPI003D7A9547
MEKEGGRKQEKNARAQSQQAVDLLPVRRSTRVVDLPPPSYKESYCLCEDVPCEIIMGRSAKEELILDEESQNVVEAELEEKLLDSIPKLPNQNRPTSMVMKAPDMGLLAPDLVMYLNISPELLKEEATVVRDTSSLSSKIKFPTRTRFFAMPHRRYMMQVIWYPWISPRLHLKC